MKRFIFSALIFLFVSSAYAKEILAPYAETPFSSGVKDRKTGEAMNEGNWAFDVTVTNDNDKPLFCKSTPFLGRLGLSDDFCARADFAAYVYPSGEGISFTIPANGKIQFGEVGYDERLKKSTDLEKDLQFCGRDGWELNCGFSCPNGKNFDETWDEGINQTGYKRMVCLRNGTAVLKELRCDSEHVPGDTWPESVANGTLYYACQQSGVISKELRCSQSPNLYVEQNGICQAPACNGVASGLRYTIGRVPFGNSTALCSHGSPIEPKIECDPGTIFENEMCRPARDCQGGVKHGLTKVMMPDGCTTACEKSRKTYQCTDSILTLIKDETVFCKPARAICA